MTPPFDTWSPKRRRTLLQLVGTTVSASALQGMLATSAAEPDNSVVMEQGDRCVELVPLEGNEPIEELYDYSYPLDRFDGPAGSQGSTYSSEGTTDLQRDRTSVLFLYDGPEGLSLVMVHGHLDGDRDAGGTITFTFEGLPKDATWIMRDDYYLKDGEQAESNYDRWGTDGDTRVVDWAYRSGRTDGGVVRGLGPDFEVTIKPAFNDEATLAADHDYGPIEAWEALAGDRDAPDRFPLRLDRPVTIRTGTCGESPNNTETTKDDKHRGKHERKQQKHQEKHQKQQRKHQEKHQKQQRKHQEKHQKQQRKHQEKHQKQQRKHQKHGG